MAEVEGELVESAELFARLLLHELGETDVAQLTQPEVAQVLAEVGVDVAPLRGDVDLDGLAVEFLEAFLAPKQGGPLVQSLWTAGSYEGDSAVAVRALARAAGVEFDREAARGAAHDHLGCILQLWAVACVAQPEVARRIERDHLAWSLAPLERLAAGEGFYAGLSRGAASLVRAILAGAGADVAGA
jgi:TorA maturation chaperone TorD